MTYIECEISGSHYNMETNKFRLKHYSYSGMTYEVEDFWQEEDARIYIAAFIRKRRKQKFPCTTLSSGERWEILEPENCQMVSDYCGVLKLYYPKFEFVEEDEEEN